MWLLHPHPAPSSPAESSWDLALSLCSPHGFNRCCWLTQQHQKLPLNTSDWCLGGARPGARGCSCLDPSQHKYPRPRRSSTDLPMLLGAFVSKFGTEGVCRAMRSREGSQTGHPATIPALLQRLRTETSLSPGKHFLLLSEINRGKKDFQIPPCCNDFSPTYSLSSPKIEELFKKRCEEKKKKGTE